MGLPHQQNMRTPLYVYQWCSRYFGPFQLDAAASPHNALCNVYYTVKENGLVMPWMDLTFCNPPWMQFDLWLDKAVREMIWGKRSLLIGPAGTSNEYVHNTIKRVNDNCITDERIVMYAPSPRLHFNTPDGKPKKGAMWNAFLYTLGYDALHHNAVDSIFFDIRGTSFNANT